MKTPFSALLLTAGICGLAAGYSHHGGEGEALQLPLHERPFVQDSEEELERKWSFEVSLSVSLSLFFCVGEASSSEGWLSSRGSAFLS